MTNVEIFSAYLPYEIKCVYKKQVEYLHTMDMFGNCESVVDLQGSYSSRPIFIEDVKLILKPLDTIDWLQCSKNLGEFLTEPMSEFIYNTKQSTFHILDAPYLLVQWLIKNHYDVFGAIEKGIAISE